MSDVHIVRTVNVADVTGAIAKAVAELEELLTLADSVTRQDALITLLRSPAVRDSLLYYILETQLRKLRAEIRAEEGPSPDDDEWCGERCHDCGEVHTAGAWHKCRDDLGAYSPNIARDNV